MVQDRSRFGVNAPRRAGWPWHGPGLALALLVLLPGALRAQSANDGFNVAVDSHVTASGVLPDGKLLIGGYFTTVNGETRTHLARLLVDGSLDASFVDIDNDGGITSMAVLGDGSVLVGGEFTHFGACECTHLARLDSNGEVDLTFHPNPDGTVNSIARERGGQLLIGGEFTHVGASTHHYLARISESGVPDDDYPSAQDPNDRVLSIALQADGKALIAGAFTVVGAQPQSRVARLLPDGSIDDTFSAPGPMDNLVWSVALQANGKILIGGYFTTLNLDARPHLARLNADGTLDPFNPAPDDFVYSLAIQADGKLLVGGNFFNIAGQEAAKIARFNVDDSLDGNFKPPYTSTSFITSSVRTFAIQADGRVVVGGAYTLFDANASAIGRLNIDGSIDHTLNPDPNAAVDAVAVQPDGKILIGGLFTALNGGSITRHYIARLNANGDVDTTLNPDADGSVIAMALNPLGQIVLGGGFTTLNGGAITRHHVARLNVDGSVDSAFDPDTNDSVHGIAIQPDGRILLGGYFTALDGGATTRNHIARLSSEGSVESGFDPDTNGDVLVVALQPDGKILLGGTFTKLNGGSITRNYIARLDANGDVDAGFNPNVGPTLGGNGVYTIAVQSDGKILLGGYFTSLDGGATMRHNIARLNADGSVDPQFSPDANNIVSVIVLQQDGKILLGGYFTSLDGGATVRHFIARLNSDGSVDDTFDPDASGVLTGITVQADGRVLLSGGISALNGGANKRYFVARLSTPQAALQCLRVNGAAVNWSRYGAGPELALPPQLSVSTDGMNYSVVGTMQRVADGWRYDEFTQPLDEVFHVRVRGSITSGYDTRSQSVIEYTQQFVGDDGVFGDGFEHCP